MEIQGYGLDYEYNWYIYGPYSPDLARDMYSLHEVGIDSNRSPQIEEWLRKLEDPSIKQRDYSHYLPSNDNVLDQFLQFRKEAFALSTQLKHEDILEILASILYLNKNLSIRDPNRLLTELLNRKEKFTSYSKFIEQSIRFLFEKSLLD